MSASLTPGERIDEEVFAVLLLFAIDLNVSPTSDGMPGAQLITKLLSWLSQLALWGSLAAILVGAAIYGLSKEGGHGYNATRGRSLAAGGAVGAILAGLAPTIVKLLFQAAS